VAALGVVAGIDVARRVLEDPIAVSHGATLDAREAACRRLRNLWRFARGVRQMLDRPQWPSGCSVSGSWSR